MLELFIIAIVFWLGYQTGVAILSYRLRHLVFREAKRLGITSKEHDHLFEEEKPIQVVQLVIEKSNDILYLYEKDTDNFICQATSIDELAVLAQKYKNIKYAAVLNGKEVYAFVDGVVKTEKEVIFK